MARVRGYREIGLRRAGNTTFLDGRIPSFAGWL